MSLRSFGTVLICLLSSLSYSITAVAGSSIHQQRSLYKEWQTKYTTWNDSKQREQLAALKDYPLYPYAQYQYLKAHLSTISSDEIQMFIKKNHDFPLSSSLMQSYIEMLTQQKKWQKIIELPIDKSLASNCRYKYALSQLNQPDKAFVNVQRLWLSANDLPSACDPLFTEWEKTGAKTANLILQRIELALSKNNIKLASYLTEQLPDNYNTLKKNLLAVFKNPQNLADFAKNITATPFSKKVVMLSFPRLANSNTDLATSLLPTLKQQQNLSEKQVIQLQKSIALNYFKATAIEEQITWRDHFISLHGDALLVEKRIRLALKNNQLDQVAYWLNLLTETDKQKDEWRYWQAVILANNNQNDEAKKILQGLAKGRGFYAMYSAQKLKQKYHFNFEYPVIANVSPKIELARLVDQYAKLPVIQRIEELRYWDNLSEAIAEWRYFLQDKNNSKQYAAIARYAYLRGWGEHSIQATIIGKLWNNWQERFPIVYRKLFHKFTQDKAISLSFALAIARQESALDPTVQSPSGAKGLMQLMPATAKDSAKKVALKEYKNATQLYDPLINIQLGSYYLDYVYQLFNKNRILASAAYNAGPNRLNRWLQEIADDLDAVAFIESIPFTETRNYVKNVLVYDYIYQLILNQKPSVLLNTNELTQNYHNAINK